VAFYHALRAAAIAHSVALACSQGSLAGCGCDRTKVAGEKFVDATPRTTPRPIKEKRDTNEKEATTVENSKWGGCSIDIKHGLHFSQNFLDSKETEEDAKALMNRHNSRAGNKVGVITV